MNSSKTTISFENFAPPEDISIVYEDIVQRNPAPGVGPARPDSPPQFRRKEERRNKRMETKPLVCPYCPNKYKVHGWLNKHKAKVHPEAEKKELVEEPKEANSTSQLYDPLRVKSEMDVDDYPIREQQTTPHSENANYWRYPQNPPLPGLPPSAYPPPPPPFQNFRGQAQEPNQNPGMFSPQPSRLPLSSQWAPPLQTSPGRPNNPLYDESMDQYLRPQGAMEAE